MSARRFTEKHELNPAAVASLPPDNAAMRENRTLFPSTVVEVSEHEPKRILISGKNNRKIGATVEKGRFKGYGIYMLTLEERATCPEDCPVRGICYGNGMHYARRHRIGNPDVFYDRLEREIQTLLTHHDGLLIRLHVLGDFPDVEYVSFWKEVFDNHQNVACFGYTHRIHGGIAAAIAAVKDAHPERFRIRWSTEKPAPDCATVLDRIPEGTRGNAGEIVCPSQIDTTACCATCALCWEVAAVSECIGFVKHGRVSPSAELENMMKEMEPAGVQDVQKDACAETRSIRPIPIAMLVPATVHKKRPRFLDVDPALLVVETKYQRDLSVRSLNLIKRIVEKFDWAKFKPPVCVFDGERYFVIDGQHTAIGVASHPEIDTIPVMVVEAETLADRAGSFVAHNRDRVAMSTYQVFHGEVAAGEAEAVEINQIVVEAGGNIPRYPPAKGRYKQGQVSAVTELRTIHRVYGPELLEKVLSVAIEARCQPISQTKLRAIRILLTQPEYEDVDRDDLVTALLARSDIETAAQRFAAETNQGRYSAAAVILYRACSSLSKRVA